MRWRSDNFGGFQSETDLETSDLTVQHFWRCARGSITGGHDPNCDCLLSSFKTLYSLLYWLLNQLSALCLLVLEMLETFSSRSNGVMLGIFDVNLPNSLIFISLFVSVDSYGSDLVVVESYQQNNISERLAQEQLNPVTHPDAAFWLGLMSLDDLSTNTLEAASGSLVQQYAGNDR